MRGIKGFLGRPFRGSLFLAIMLAAVLLVTMAAAAGAWNYRY